MTKLEQIAELEQVRLDAFEGRYKFVELRDRDSDRRFIRGSPRYDWHRDNVGAFRAEARQAGDDGSFFCPGGGWVYFDPEARTAVFHRSSGDYGRFDNDSVRSMVEPYLKEHGFTVEKCETGW